MLEDVKSAETREINLKNDLSNATSELERLIAEKVKTLDKKNIYKQKVAEMSQSTSELQSQLESAKAECSNLTNAAEEARAENEVLLSNQKAL